MSTIFVFTLIFCYLGATWQSILDQKMLQYTKTIIFMVKGLEVVAKRCFWISFHDDLCCYVGYSNVEIQVEIFNTYH
jgi:hypothetical protein